MTITTWGRPYMRRMPGGPHGTGEYGDIVGAPPCGCPGRPRGAAPAGMAVRGLSPAGGEDRAGRATAVHHL